MPVAGGHEATSARGGGGVLAGDVELECTTSEIPCPQ